MTRKQLLRNIKQDIDVQEASPRVDQRKVPQPPMGNLLLQTIEKKLVTLVIDELKEKKITISINPRMLVSERKNPIEENYEVLEVIGTGGYGEVKKVRHRNLDVIRALKIIKKSKYKNPNELKLIKQEI